MGITKSRLYLLALEQNNHPIIGDTLIISQQAVLANKKEVERIFQGLRIKLHPLADKYDTKNKIPAWIGSPLDDYTNVQTVMTMLGAAKVVVADVSDYEKADIIMDLNYAVDDKHHEKYDVIFDSGSLEHIFDIPMALANLVKMLKIGGRIILFLPASNAIDHGFYSFSPTLFYDYFSSNGFAEFSCYLIEGSSYNQHLKSKIYRYNYVDKDFPIISKNSVDVCFMATKTKVCSQITKPSQNIYSNYYWDRTKCEKGAINKASAIARLLKWIQYRTRYLRPEILDIIYKNICRGKNISYLGKH